MISVGRSTLIFASVAVLLLGLSVGLFLLQSGRLSACERRPASCVGRIVVGK